MRYLTPVPKQFVDHSGIPYSDGTVSVYLSGDSELADIYEDAEGDALYPNPCRLDANGAWQCFVPGGVPLDYIVKDKNGNVVFEFYDILPSGGGTAVYNIMGVEGETAVTKRSNAEGNITATVGLDPEFKQRVTDAENDIGDLNERVDGVEGSIQELNDDLDHLGDRVDDVEADVDGLHGSLNSKKDRQTPYSINDIPPDRTVKSITQDADGRMQVETQPIQYPGHDQIDIESPEGTLEIHKTYSEGRQDFTADVADNSLGTDKMMVDQFHYIDVDGTTMSSHTDGHTTILSSLDVVVTTSSTYETVKGVIDAGKHPILEVDGVYYRLIGTAAGSEVGGEPTVSYNFGCFPAETVVALDKYKCKVYNIDVTNGWTSAGLDFYTASKIDSLIGSATTYKFVNTTEQWLADVADASVRLWYVQNNSVNRASIDLDSSHQTLCYIYATLPALVANEAYRLTFEITLTNRYQDLDADRKCALILDAEENNYELLGEFAQDGAGGFIPVNLTSLELPFFYNSTVKYKVYVDGHSYRAVRIA